MKSTDKDAEIETKVDEIQELFDKIGKMLQDKKIDNALILLQDEHNEKRMFMRGEFYEVAKLVATASRTVKQKMSEDLRDL